MFIIYVIAATDKRQNKIKKAQIFDKASEHKIWFLCQHFGSHQFFALSTFYFWPTFLLLIKIWQSIWQSPVINSPMQAPIASTESWKGIKYIMAAQLIYNYNGLFTNTFIWQSRPRATSFFSLFVFGFSSFLITKKSQHHKRQMSRNQKRTTERKKAKKITIKDGKIVAECGPLSTWLWSTGWLRCGGLVGWWVGCSRAKSVCIVFLLKAS